MMRALSVKKIGFQNLWSKWFQSCPVSSRIVFVKTESSSLDIAQWNPRFHHYSQQEENKNVSQILAVTHNLSYFRPIQRKNSQLPKQGSLDVLMSSSNLLKKIEQASDVPALLGMLGSERHNIFVDNRAKPNLLINWLKRLCSLVSEKGLTQEDLEIVKNHENFQQLLQQLDKNIMNMKSHDITDGLGYLLEIYPEDNYTIESFENHIRWLLRRMYLPKIEKVLIMHENHQETTLRQDMLKFIQAVSEKRWGELLDPADLITLMYDKEENVSDRFITKVEAKALDLCRQMSTKNLYRVIYHLAKKKRRNTPLLRGAMYYLSCQPHINLIPVHLMNLLYALASFKLYHPALFEKLAVAVIGQIHHFEPHMVSSVLTSVGVARFRHPKLLDTLTEYFSENLTTVTPSDLSSLVITLANLNYQPQMLSDCFPKFLAHLWPLRQSNKKAWLDVVWSAAVLNRLTSDMVESVMTSEFYEDFTGMDSFRATPCHLKLANISAIVTCDLPSYSGPNLPDDYLKTKDLTFSKRSERPFHTQVLETLLNIAPGEKYAKTNVLTPSGSTIDVEFIVNQQGDVQPYADYKPAFGEVDPSLKDLPDNLHRIALRVSDYQDMTTYTVVPNGVSVITARLLKNTGYKPVELTFHDFPTKGTVVNKVAYLQGKLREMIQ